MDPMGTRPALAAAAGAAVFEFGGRSFVLPPFDAADKVAVAAEFRRQCMAEADDPLVTLNQRVAAANKAGTPLDPSLVAVLADKALAAGGRKERKAEPSDAEVSARIHTVDGFRYFLWVRLRKADPTVTREWVGEQVPDETAIEAVSAALLVHDGFAHLDPKKA